MSKGKVSLGKAEQVLSKSLVDSIADLAEDEIEQLIVKTEQDIRKIKLERKNDTKLNAAKDIVKDLNAAYSAAVAQSEAKKNFLLDKLEELQADLEDAQ
jgi:hypothetical protein